MIVPKLAPVRPRVTLPVGEGESLLEDAVPLCAIMTETLAPLFIRVEGQEGISHGEDHGQ